MVTPQAAAERLVSDYAKEGAEEWAAMSPLPAAPSAPTMLEWMVPAPFRRWLTDVTERASIPLEFVACPALVGLGTVVGRHIGIRPGRYDDYLVVPNSWGGIVAPSVT